MRAAGGQRADYGLFTDWLCGVVSARTGFGQVRRCTARLGPRAFLNRVSQVRILPGALTFRRVNQALSSGNALGA
ncbi:hypothetical protein GCM10018963_19400 [Saccharothrix longispora]